MFIDEMTGAKIYAPLDASLIHGTHRNCDLIPAFMDAVRDTAEYAQIMMCPTISWGDKGVIFDPSATDSDERWSSDDVDIFLLELNNILESYAPEGYYFGTHIGDGSDFGFWKCEC